MHQTLPLVPIRHTICHSRFTCSTISDIPSLTLPKSLNMYGDCSAVRKAERGAHKIQADALNDDINVTAICDVHTSLKSRFPPPPTPPPSIAVPFLSFVILTFMKPAAWQEMKKRAQREQREKVFSLHIDFLIPREPRIQ